MKNGLTTLPKLTYRPDIAINDQESPEFFDTVGANLAYRYDPLIDRIREINNFGWLPELEEGFNPVDNISEDLKPYAVELARAKSKEHLSFLEKELRNSIASRDVMGKSSTLSALGAEFFDPINYVPLPFIRGARGVSKALRTGAATSGLVATQEAIRYPFDPLATPQEAFMNIGTAFAIGTSLQGAISIPKTRRARATLEAEKEINNLKAAIDPDYKPKGNVAKAMPQKTATKDLNIADSIFTNSWLYNAVTTPMKRVLQDKSIPDSVKLATLEIANDSGILLAANKAGKALKPSVFQNTKLLEGEMVRTYDELVKIWGRATGKGVIDPMDYMHKRSDFEEWVTAVDVKAMKGQKAANDYEQQAMTALNKYYDAWEVRLREQGLIGNNQFYKRDISRRQLRIEELNENLKAVKKNSEKVFIKRAIANQQREIDRQTAILNSKPDPKVMPPNETIFRPRYWDRNIIKKNREEFEQVLFRWFKDNPTQVEKVSKEGREIITLSQKKSDVQKRVKELTDKIINNTDDLDFDKGFFGFGKSKHMKHRLVDIPNSEVTKFIHTNPIQVMRAYVTRTGSRYEFAKQFGSRSIDDLLDEQEVEMILKGVKENKRFAVLKDMRHLYERVAGSVIHRDPSTWDYQVAEILRTAAQVGYLGKAGVSTLTEPAKIIMEHGIGPTMKGLFSFMKNNQLKLGAKEARIAGEALEILFGSVHMRLVEDLGNNPLRSNIFDKTKNAFYLLNGLAPITRIFKDFDAMMRSHTLIDYSVRLAKGEASQMETEYLARYLIDKDIAKRIANQKKAKWQQNDSGLYLANSDAWTDKLAQNRFRAALSSGVANTILMGTPADKPIITDGVAYIPMRVAKLFGMKEDSKYRGYSRIESGLLGLPFQFYSYSLAAVNKTMGAMAHGQLKSQFIGVAAAMGLGYMVLQTRTPDFVEMDFEDQFARAFDYSGIAPLFSDLFYTAMATSLALGGPNITGGLLEAKYPQEPNTVDAATAVLGAGPSIAVDYARAFDNLFKGNIEESKRELRRIIPFYGIPYINAVGNNLSRAVEENYGTVTIGRN